MGQQMITDEMEIKSDSLIINDKFRFGTRLATQLACCGTCP